MATHSPLLMAYPGAAVLAVTPREVVPTTLEDTSQFRLLKRFFQHPGSLMALTLQDGGEDEPGF